MFRVGIIFFIYDELFTLLVLKLSLVLKLISDLTWHVSSPKKVFKGGKEGGAVVTVTKNRVVDMPESKNSSVLCV